MPAKPAAINTLFGKEFHRSSICCMKKYLLLFWKQLLQLCLNSRYLLHWKRQWAAHPPTPPPHHLGFYRPESNWPRRWSPPEPKPTQPEAEYHTYVLVARSQGIREFTKMFLLPRLLAHPHCNTSPHAHWLDIERTDCNSHAKLSVGQWSQILNHQCERAEFPQLLSSWYSVK